MITSAQMKAIFFENKAFGEKIFRFFLKNKQHDAPKTTIQAISYSDFIYNSTISFFE